MIHPVTSNHLADIIRIHAFETSQINTILIRVRTALMMGIDAANSTEIMLRGMGIKLVHLKLLLPLNDA
ncbi:hypothetical protein AYI87_01240 [Shewanella sp. KCT]|nr:hypothetical protein AYI87_01240 [Shewanella sp. KCT]